jgi:hypothetical protein
MAEKTGSSSPETETLFEFPCHFPIKVMGKAEVGFASLIETIIRRHVNEEHMLSVTQTDSRTGKYVSLTVTVCAQTKPQLDAIYTDLSRHDLVIMAL